LALPFQCAVYPAFALPVTGSLTHTSTGRNVEHLTAPREKGVV
jgi:hypothetical protein